MSLLHGVGSGLGGAGDSGGALGSFFSHTIDQSLRFNDDDSAYLSRTPASAGNRDVNTTSFWVKRANLGTTQTIFSAGSSFPSNHNNSTVIQFRSDDTLRYRSESGGSAVAQLDTTRVFRDVSSWYHILLTYESTNSTSTDRIKLYVNGVRETAFDVETYPNSGVDNFFASDSVHQIGRSTTNYIDCYLAEVHFLDGLAYDPSYFGETKDGVWIPKEYSGSHGTNGFHLPFANAASSGASAFFLDSGNSYVQFTDANHYDIGSSDDFTIEFFINFTTAGAADYSYVFGNYEGTSGPYLSIQYSNSANAFYFYYGNGQAFTFTFSSGDIVAGKWHHVAINRASGNLDAFLDGTRLGGNQTSNSTAWNQNNVRIGMAQSNGTNSVDGYISNVRMVVGSAVYSSGSSITVPTSTLTAVTNTQLLALTTSTMTADASSNNVTGTLSGSGYFGTSGYSPFANFNFNDDQSGNANNFAANNVFPHDVVPDSPTNNFATMNTIYHSSRQADLLNGNLDVQNSQNFSNPGANSYGAVSTFAIPRDKKVYIEVQCSTHTGVYWYAGFATKKGLEAGVSSTQTAGESSVVFYNRAVMKNGTQFQYSSSSGVGGLGGGTSPFAIDDVLGMAVDGSNGKVWFSKNGTYFKTIASNNGSTGNTGNPSAGTDEVAIIDDVPEEDLFVVIGTGQPAVASVNFGQDSRNVSSANADSEGIGTFQYAVPTDYVSLCAANLTTDAISPTQSSQADDHFNTVLYTGNGNNPHAITGVGFQPDWVWIKDRSNTYNHQLHDVVRGADNALLSNEPDKETDFNSFVSFDSDGFSVTGANGTNKNSATHVSWNWKAGGAPTADNSAAANAEPTAGSAKIDGSNQSGAFSGSPSIAIKRLSASTTAGFSIVKWTGTGSAGTIPHGLGAAPEFYTVKNLTDDSTNWQSYHRGIASDAETDYIYLNSAAAADDSDDWNDTAPNANVFSVKTHNQVNASGDDYVAYLFTPIQGYSKFGNYTGNADADGTFVYLGFRPRWFMLKDATNNNIEWNIYYDEASPFNVMNDYLAAASNAAEATNVSTRNLDFLSNGVKLRDQYAQNYSANFIYLAFAQAPFKFANAR